MPSTLRLWTWMRVKQNDSGFLFRFSGDKWVYNLSTAGLNSGTYTISIKMPDGFNRRTGFVLK